MHPYMPSSAVYAAYVAVHPLLLGRAQRQAPAARPPPGHTAVNRATGVAASRRWHQAQAAVGSASATARGRDPTGRRVNTGDQRVLWGWCRRAACKRAASRFQPTQLTRGVGSCQRTSPAGAEGPQPTAGARLSVQTLTPCRVVVYTSQDRRCRAPRSALAASQHPRQGARAACCSLCLRQRCAM